MTWIKSRSSNRYARINGAENVEGEPAPASIGGYALERELGRGGQATVWLAKDPRLGRRVALKVLDVARSDAPALLARFRREAEILVICKSGGRSARATAFQIERGWRRVFNVATGTDGWAARGLPVER